MKLRELIRANPEIVKRDLKLKKRQKRDIPDEWINIKADGEGDNARRNLGSHPMEG